MLIASNMHIVTGTKFGFSHLQLGSTATSAETGCAHSMDSCLQTSTEFRFACSNCLPAISTHCIAQLPFGHVARHRSWHFGHNRLDVETWSKRAF